MMAQDLIDELHGYPPELEVLNRPGFIGGSGA